jgi:hypothetical protein
MTLVIPPSSSSVEIGISLAPYPNSSVKKTGRKHNRMAQLTLQGKLHDTPPSITGLLQR